MIFGKVDVIDGAIETHNDSYLLKDVTTISARRPFLGGFSGVAGLILAFAFAFFELLKLFEVAVLLGFASGMVFVGLWLGHLQLSSLSLRGTELGTAIWGDYWHLNRVRREAARAIHTLHQRKDRP